MHRSVIILVLTFAAIFTVGKYGVADEPLPQSLLELLKPDMRVGIRWITGTAAVALNVYSKEQYLIARDTRNLTLDQLKKKYVAVDKQVHAGFALVCSATDQEFDVVPLNGELGRS